MRLTNHHQGKQSGVALMIVMIVIISLSLLAMGFVMSMKVETRLARNSQLRPDMDWLGRSGVELARYVLAQSLNNPSEPYDSLNQFWAGGFGGTNLFQADISLEDVHLGNGVINVRITDMERRFNINSASEQILQQALIVMGVDAAESGTVVSSIQDWIDPDDDTHIGGTETAFYQQLSPPYTAKNGPLDDISELLMINGITPDMYWGTGSGGYVNRSIPSVMNVGFPEGVVYPVGLVDLFTTLSDSKLNINTAGPYALQLIPGMDENRAYAILSLRDGPDGTPGTEDDFPFRSLGDLTGVPGMDPVIQQQIAAYCNTRSTTFQVEVEATIGEMTRNYIAIVRRNNQKDLPILQFYWK
jgi:general secretion pathway protein K